MIIAAVIGVFLFFVVPWIVAIWGFSYAAWQDGYRVLSVVVGILNVVGIAFFLYFVFSLE